MGCGSSNPSASVPPQVVTSHLSLASLKGQTSFGPYLKLRSYDPGTRQHTVTVLVVLAPAAHSGAPALSVSGASAGAAELLDTQHGFEFWRFAVTTTAGDDDAVVTYQLVVPGFNGHVSTTAAYSFHVPSARRPWHWAFTSCNGTTDDAAAVKSGGISVMWRDVLARHKASPLHLAVGGGDQIYNDAVFSGPLLGAFDKASTDAETAERLVAPLTDAMRREAEQYYLAHYCLHFAQDAFSTALASVPHLSTWDDHDIFDGYGSYSDQLQASPIMRGVFGAAKSFYLLFQCHTTEARMQDDGMFGGTTNQLVQLGGDTALLLLDTRMQRTLTQVVAPPVYDKISARLSALPPSTSHVVVVTGVPVLYPKLPVEKLLSTIGSFVAGTNPVAVLSQKTGLAQLINSRFGQPEIVDDLADHWSAESHKDERDRLLRMLLKVACNQRVRVSLLAGDVHVAGCASLFTVDNSTHSGIDKDSVRLQAACPPDEDVGYIPQIISSAIGNEPTPGAVVKALEAAGVLPVRMLDKSMAWKCDKPFGDDRRLYAGRNWCEVETDTGGGLLFQLRCEPTLGAGVKDVFKVMVPKLVSSDVK